MELWSATGHCDIERCSLLSSPQSQSHIDNEKARSSVIWTRSLKCLSCLKDVGGAGSVVAGRALESWTLIISGLFKAFGIFPPTHDLRAFVLIEEVKAPGHLRVCSRRSVTLDGQYTMDGQAGRPVSSGLSAQSSDCASVPTQQGTPVQDEPSRRDRATVF